MSACRSCHAEVVWVVLTTGRRMPLDPAPVERGTVVLDRPDNLGRVVPASAEVPEGTPRFAPHFATCPNASAHRRSR